MKKIQSKPIQATIRNVPPEVEAAIKRRAKISGKSINEAFLEALSLGAGEKYIKRRDLGFLSGSLSDSEAEKLEKEIERQHIVDERLWK